MKAKQESETKRTVIFSRDSSTALIIQEIQLSFSLTKRDPWSQEEQKNWGIGIRVK